MVAGRAAGAPVGTWTVLFTDQVASAAMRVAVGEHAFDRIRADLDACVGAVLAAHSVVVTKSTGDGVMAGFTSTAAALQCAVAIQQAIAEHNRAAGNGVGGDGALAVRIGISVGDAVVDDGDLQGTAVVEAARLCAVANSGTILCSEAVRVVSANGSGCTFGPTSPVVLKGLPGPALTHEVAWAPPPYQADATRLAFRVLGPLEVVDRDRVVSVGGPKERLVLAVLLAQVNSPVSVDALIDAVWGERPPRTAERTVHAYVARLRRSLEPARPHGATSTLLVTVGRSYELRLSAAQLDATQFEELAKDGAAMLERGGDAASATLREALGLWRGEAFGEFREVEACAAAARRLAELRLAVLEDRMDAELASGQSGGLVAEIETLLREEPFRERLWGQLILALYRSGRQRDALEAYQRARRLLADELGIEPGPDLRRLEAAVLAQNPSLDVLDPAAATAPAGLPGALAAVGPAFIGRETELAWLGEAWAEAVDGRGGFVSVLGSEGIGKTRLVAELARVVHGDGAAVLYSRCDHAHRGARSLLGQALQSAGSSLVHVGAAADDVDMAEAVARYLPAWSRGGPVLIVLDDLHLADAETLEMVADLAAWCRATPMLVIGAFRSEPGSATSDAQPPGGAASQLPLGPLSSEAVAHICDLYATEPWSAVDLDRVYELTGGVPLLVHEHASEWARDRATRRMAEAGDRIAATRRRLITSRGEIADGVEGLQRLLDQRRAQLAGREAQLHANVVAALAGCPYKGLARFEPADAANFFGRERIVAELIARLAESSLLAVVGPSGSGKSSLVRAGLLPALAAGLLPGGQPWHAAILCPGPHPGRELGRAAHDTDRLAAEPRILFVDQFEETFTAGADHQEQDAFIGRLLDLADRPNTAVVLAIRADHLGRCATHPALADRLTGNDILVGPMRDSELRRTVELPAQRSGLDVEPGLVEVIVADVAGRAGALPLLSTALVETWERREATSLTLDGYRAAGGVNGALARMAEDAYATLPAGPRAAARRVLLRLCDAGDNGDLSLRRRLPVDETADEHDTDARTALQTLADRRLLTIDSDAVEVAHEALLREWPRLRAWLDEDVQGRRLHRRLQDTAQSWEAAGRDPSELYRGTRLDAAHDWATSHEDELNLTERAFLDASAAAATAERQAVAARARHQARQNRRLRSLLAATAVLLAVALGAGLVAVGRTGETRDQRDTARAAQQDAELEALVNRSLALRPTDRSAAALLAVEAYRRRPDARARSALLGTFQSAPGFMGYRYLPAEFYVSGALVPGTSTAVVALDGRDLKLLDLDSGEVDDPFPPRTAIPATVPATQVSGDGRFVAQFHAVNSRSPCPDLAYIRETEGRGCAAFTVHALDTGRRVLGPVIPPFGLGDVAINHDGSLVAVSGGYDGDVALYRTADGLLVGTVPGIPRPDGVVMAGVSYTAALAFAPDGRLVVGSIAGPIRVVDPSTAGVVATLDAPPRSSNVDLVALQSGVVLAAGDTTLVAVDPSAGETLWTADGRTGSDYEPCTGLAPAEGTGQFYCGSYSGAIEERDLATGQRTGMRREAQLGGLSDLAITPDSRELVVFGAAAPVISRWRVDGSGPVTAHVAEGQVVMGGFDPSGENLLVAGRDELTVGSSDRRDFAVWDPVTDRVVDPIDEALSEAIWAGPDLLAVAYADGTIGLYDVAARRRVDLGDVAVVREPVSRAWLSAGDTRLYVSRITHSGCEIRTYDPGARTRVEPTITLDGCANVRSLSATPDGDRVVVTAHVPTDPDIPNERSGEEITTVHDGATGEQVDGRLLGLSRVGVTEDLLAGADSSGGITLYDLATLRPEGKLPGSRGVGALTISADGAVLLAASFDSTVSLYDVASRTRIGEPIPGRLPRPDMSPGVLRPDGRAIAVTDRDGVAVWDLSPDRLADAACQLAGRNLTRTEWDTYLAGLGEYQPTCPEFPPDTSRSAAARTSDR